LCFPPFPKRRKRNHQYAGDPHQGERLTPGKNFRSPSASRGTVINPRFGPSSWTANAFPSVPGWSLRSGWQWRRHVESAKIPASTSPARISRGNRNGDGRENCSHHDDAEREGTPVGEPGGNKSGPTNPIRNRRQCRGKMNPPPVPDPRSFSITVEGGPE